MKSLLFLAIFSHKLFIVTSGNNCFLSLSNSCWRSFFQVSDLLTFQFLWNHMLLYEKGLNIPLDDTMILLVSDSAGIPPINVHWAPEIELHQAYFCPEGKTCNNLCESFCNCNGTYRVNVWGEVLLITRLVSWRNLSQSNSYQTINSKNDYPRLPACALFLSLISTAFPVLLSKLSISHNTKNTLR